MTIESTDPLITVDEESDATIVAVRSSDEFYALEQTASQNQSLLKDLYAAQKNIGKAFTLDETMDAVSQEIMRLIERATHVTLILRQEEGDAASQDISQFRPFATRTKTQPHPEVPVSITRTVLRRIIKDKAAVLAADARIDVGETASIMGANITSVMGVPLWYGATVQGVIQVDNRSGSGLFRERDLDVLAVLAQTSSQAVAHAQLFEQLQQQADRQRRENAYLKRKERVRRFENIIGESAAMRHLFDQLQRVIDTPVTVLVEGETGTGKELVASALHYRSQRSDKLFVAQNCAALPEALLESELFGHKKGAFTGATEEKKGLFELADKGTMFLDEVTEMPLTLQAKLLRVLQEGEVRPLGSPTVRKVDVRVVAACNRNVEQEVAAGRFREDLYYRLKVFPICVPPLRERDGDIELLAKFFLRRYTNEFAKPVKGFSEGALADMRVYRWPGNVRELENEVQRLVIQADPNVMIESNILSPRIHHQVEPQMAFLGDTSQTTGSLRAMTDAYERTVIGEALRKFGNNKSATAKALGITREGLHKKLKALGLGA